MATNQNWFLSELELEKSACSPQVWGKVMFLHMSVCSQGEEICLQGVCIQGGLGRPPRKLEKRVVCILLECFLVRTISKVTRFVQHEFLDIGCAFSSCSDVAKKIIRQIDILHQFAVTRTEDLWQPPHDVFVHGITSGTDSLGSLQCTQYRRICF